MKKAKSCFSKKRNDRTKNDGSLSCRRDAVEYDWFNTPSDSTPEIQLAVAILQRAIMDLLTAGVDEEDKLTAMNWISGNFGLEYEAEYEFSFTRIVELISGLSADEFRTRVFKFLEEATHEKSLADNFRFQRTKKRLQKERGAVSVA